MHLDVLFLYKFKMQVILQFWFNTLQHIYKNYSG